MNQTPVDNPTEELWGCIADSSDHYRVEFSSREQALAALDGEAGAIVRCRRGFMRDGLEYMFDVAQILSRVEERAEVEGQILAHFDLGVFNTDEVQEDDLRRRLADALFGWIETLNLPSWVITELEDIEATTNAQDHIP